MTLEKEVGIREMLDLYKGSGPFAEVPVVWILKRSGPRMSVSRNATGKGVSVRLNTREFSLEIVRRALKAANEIHRSTTLASVISSESPEGVHRTREYVPTKAEREEKWEMELEDWREGMKDRLGELFMGEVH
jgi:hypothetical protein